MQLSVVMSRSILKSVLSPHKLWSSNSPGSCCRGQLWWGYCWGQTRGRAPPWCREPLHSLKMSKQRGRPMLLECRLISAEEEPAAQNGSSAIASWKWFETVSQKVVILTIQPCHTGVVNFELFALQILHGEMGTAQQMRFIFRSKDTKLITSCRRVLLWPGFYFCSSQFAF